MTSSEHTAHWLVTFENIQPPLLIWPSRVRRLGVFEGNSICTILSLRQLSRRLKTKIDQLADTISTYRKIWLNFLLLAINFTARGSEMGEIGSNTRYLDTPQE